MDGREERVYDCCLEIEKNLKLVGVTAVEDKLQEGVPETISNLTNAGLKIWVLTGDKQETAINVGQACRMLRPSTELLVVDAECFPGVEQQLSDALTRLEYTQAKIDRFANDKILIKAIRRKIKAEIDRQHFALIINGHSLFHALTPQLEDLFLRVACSCQAVICCRAAPLQKGKVVELVKQGRNAMTLAIGDGGNDVNMIRTADIGVGISGKEGRQAVLTSDIALGQFRFLQRLLLVHGRWNYMRMSTFLNFFFFKTLAFALCQFWYGFTNGWSAMSVYDQWFITAYTFIYTATPLLYITLFEQDVNDNYSQLFPKLYYPGMKSEYFNLLRFVMALSDGVLTSLVNFLILVFGFARYQYFDGNTITSSHAAMGVALGTMTVLIVTLRCCLETSHWTGFNFWPAFSVAAVFSVQYGISLVAYRSTRLTDGTAFYGVWKAVWTSPNFWMCFLAAAAITCLPILFIRAFKCIMKVCNIEYIHFHILIVCIFFVISAIAFISGSFTGSM